MKLDFSWIWTNSDKVKSNLMWTCTFILSHGWRQKFNKTWIQMWCKFGCIQCGFRYIMNSNNIMKLLWCKYIMVHNGWITELNLKCLNNGWISDQVFCYQTGNEVFSFGSIWWLNNWIGNWVFCKQIGTALFIFDYLVTESVINYWMIRNWLFGDHLFSNKIGNQLFSSVSHPLIVN